MKRKRRLHIGAEVDPDLWEQFREQAFAENLTTGQLLDRLMRLTWIWYKTTTTKLPHPALSDHQRISY